MHLILGTFCLVILASVWTAESAKILALLNVVSPSHHIFNRALSRALAARGHQVTVLSPDKDKDNFPNLTYIHMEGVYEAIHAEMDYVTLTEETPIQMVLTMYDWIGLICDIEFKTAGMQKLLDYPSTEKFDLIITEGGFTECTYGFIPKFGSPPVVAISGFGIPAWTGQLMGTPENPSYIPNSILPYTAQMSFAQRVYNSLITGVMVFLYEYSHIPNMETFASKYFKEKLPSFWEIERNFSIFLANIDYGLDGARPVSPNIIPVAGMHIRANPDPLPKDLKEFLDGAKDGFIFFSLGSNVRSDKLPAEKRKAIIDAFAELPQRILWKFETENLTGLSPNVKIGKWLPQSDILAHPKIKMFVSHCGKMSTTEAVYRGVPIVGIPFFADQLLNIRSLKDKGVAVGLDIETLTKQSLLTAIKEILNNPSYTVNMKKLSAVLRDHPESALDRAVFWTEYVIRHGGAPHLKPESTRLSWYQYFLLDVMLFLLTVVLVVILVVYVLVKKLYRIITGSPTKKTKIN